MKREAFEQWVKALTQAWENRDPQAAADLFTEDATYQENPFDEPLRGREAIMAYWADLPREQDHIRVSATALSVTDTTGVAAWTATFTRLPSRQRARLEGVLIASFSGDSDSGDSDSLRAHTFREWWHARDEPSSRPVAIITGASRGLGATLAAFLAGQGYRLILTARGAEALAAAAQDLASFDAEVVTIAGDVSDAAHRQQVIAAAAAFGRLDLLVNNASTLGPMATQADYPVAEFERMYRVNVAAPVALTQGALPLLKQSNGLVVNITSDAAIGGYETWGGYGSSKAALDLISKTQANELREAGVSVVSVDPGDMRTAMHQEAFPGEDISDRPEPDVTLPFWAWLLAQDRMAVSGERFQAQAEQWAVPV